jgi:hypothetical protein
MTRSKPLEELLEQARAEGHQVIEIDATRDSEGRAPWLVVRHGEHAAVIRPLTFDDHLCVDVDAFADGEPATAGAFGMTGGHRVAFPWTGHTSHGWNSAGQVSVLIGGQAEVPEPEEDIRGHVRELHPKVTLRGRTDEEVARAHGRDHHQNGSRTHHHGANAGPHGRPAGWRTGSGVVRLSAPAGL